MCLYERPSVVAYKSVYTDQCVCYFHEVFVHCIQTYLKFSVLVLVQYSSEVT